MNKEKSKQISYLLRHNPEDLVMSNDGYVDVDALLKKLEISKSDLDSIVSENNKQRFSYADSDSKIRANQGHTITVEINFQKVTDESIVMYHGTSLSNEKSIMKDGLIPMKRNYVHLSKDIETATQVGLRHAKNKKDLVIYHVSVKELLSDNIDVFISENGVYQIKTVPAKYLHTKTEFLN